MKDNIPKTRQDKGEFEFFKFFYYTKDKTTIIRSSILTIFNLILTLLFYFNLGYVINSLLQEKILNKYLQIYFFETLLFLILLLIFNTINFRKKSHAISELSHNLRFSIYYNGLFLNKIEDSTNINEISSNFISSLLISEKFVVIIISGIVLTSITMWKVAIPVTIILIILAIVFYFGNKFVDQIQDDNSKKTAKKVSKADEILASFTSVEAFQKDIFECDRYCQIFNLLEKMFNKYTFLKDVVIEFFSCLFTLILLCYSSYLTAINFEFKYNRNNNDEMSRVVVFTFLFIGDEIISYLALLKEIKKLQVSGKKVFAIFQENKITDSDQKRFKKSILNDQDFKGKIEFVDVGLKNSLKSDNTDSDWLVRHLSFCVEAGQTAAVVGEFGCGKTAVLELLAGLREADEGRILIDGIDITTINTQCLKKLISVASQDSDYFSKSFKILLLNELLYQGDKMNQKFVGELMKRKVAKVIVTNQEETVFKSDKIIVLKDGRCEEEGNNDDLAKKDGLYASLVQNHFH